MLLDLYPVMKQEYLSKEEGKEEKAFPLGKNTHHNSWFLWDRLRLPVTFPWLWFTLPCLSFLNQGFFNFLTYGYCWSNLGKGFIEYYLSYSWSGRLYHL